MFALVQNTDLYLTRIGVCEIRVRDVHHRPACVRTRLPARSGRRMSVSSCDVVELEVDCHAILWMDKTCVNVQSSCPALAHLPD